MDFKAGDIVTLKSEETRMTVEYIEAESKSYPGNPFCRCVSRIGGEIRHDSIRVSALQKISEKSIKKT